MEKLTIEEFRKQAGVSRQTIYDWMARGFIQRKNFGKKPYFDIEDLLNVPAIKKTLKQNQHKLKN
jgi:DNA-binding transcriptional MerR regulator